MRWKWKDKSKDGWYPWFAWYPTRLPSGEWVWLEWIERYDEHWMYGVTYKYRESKVS